MNSGGVPPKASPSIAVLAVSVGGLRCGFVAEDVVSVHPAARPQPLPGAPPIIEGILNIAGRIVPLLDLRRRLGLAPERLRARQHLVELRVQNQHVAVRVDRAESLATTPGDAISDVPAEGRAVIANGVIRLPDGLLVIYHPSRFLDPAEMDQIEAALEVHSAVSDGA